MPPFFSLPGHGRPKAWTRVLAAALFTCLGSSGCSENRTTTEESPCRIDQVGFTPFYSDDDRYFLGLDCPGATCAKRKALSGTGRTFQMDVTRNAQENGERSPSSAALTLHSDNPDSVEVYQYRTWRDACRNVWLIGRLRFQSTGRGSVQLLDGDRERARFSFDVVEADSVRLAVYTIWRGNSLVGAGSRPGWALGQVGDRVLLDVAVLDASGDELWPEDLLELTVDNPGAARIVPPRIPGERTYVEFLVPGTTRLYARVHELEAVLELLIEEADASDIGVDGGTDADAGRAE